MGVVLDYEPCDECKENRKLGVTLMEEAAERMFSGFLNDKDALFVDRGIYDQVVGGNAQ